MATKVKLRQKIISDGRKSLYLDFYPPIFNPKTGKTTRREFLGMYVLIDKTELKKEIELKERLGKDIGDIRIIYKSISPLSPFERKHNTETLKVAESIRQKRENTLNKPEIYNEYEKRQLRIKELGELDFIDYFQTQANKRKDSNRSNWLSALNYLNTFFNGKLKFSELNEQ